MNTDTAAGIVETAQPFSGLFSPSRIPGKIVNPCDVASYGTGREEIEKHPDEIVQTKIPIASIET